MTLDRFPNDVLEQLGWYVYRLIDPATKQTFYVGKGTGNRVFDHVRGQLAPSEDDLISQKIEVIRDILGRGQKVKHIIHRHGMDEKTAFEVEAALIEAYPNLTNIQGGYATIVRGAMTAEAIVELYALEEAKFIHRLVVIDVSRSFARRENARTIEGRSSLLDAVRFMWKLDIRRAGRCEYVLAHRGGVILGVFKPQKWLPATRENFPEFESTFARAEMAGKEVKRIGFKGYEVDDQTLGLLYKNKRVPAELRNAPRAPCRYVGV